MFQSLVGLDDNEGRYPLHFAAGYSNASIVKVSVFSMCFNN